MIENAKRPAWLYGSGCCSGWTPGDGCPHHTGRPAMSLRARELDHEESVASLQRRLARPGRIFG